MFTSIFLEEAYTLNVNSDCEASALLIYGPYRCHCTAETTCPACVPEKHRDHATTPPTVPCAVCQRSSRATHAGHAPIPGSGSMSLASRHIAWGYRRKAVSLDVYLTLPESSMLCPLGSGIFVREQGSMRELSEAEWYDRYPDREPVRAFVDGPTEGRVYRANITHNLIRMAKAAGCYGPVWRPEEQGIATAAQLLPHLTHGIVALLERRAHFEEYNPSNGWGNYDGLVRFLTAYALACTQWPEAQVSVWR